MAGKAEISTRLAPGAPGEQVAVKEAGGSTRPRGNGLGRTSGFDVPSVQADFHPDAPRRAAVVQPIPESLVTADASPAGPSGAAQRRDGRRTSPAGELTQTLLVADDPRPASSAEVFAAAPDGNGTGQVRQNIIYQQAGDGGTPGQRSDQAERAGSQMSDQRTLAGSEGGHNGPPGEVAEGAADDDNSVPEEVIRVVGLERARELGRLSRAMVGFQHFKTRTLRLDELHSEQLIDKRTKRAIDAVSLEGGISISKIASKSREHVGQIRSTNEEHVPHLQERVGKVDTALAQANELIRAFTPPQELDAPLPLPVDEFLPLATEAYDSLYTVTGELPNPKMFKDMTALLEAEMNARAVDRMATGFNEASAEQRDAYRRVDGPRSRDLNEANAARIKRDALMDVFEELGDQDAGFQQANRPEDVIHGDLAKIRSVGERLATLALQFEGSNDMLMTIVRRYFTQPVKDFSAALVDAQQQLASGEALGGGPISSEDAAVVNKYFADQARRIEHTAKIIGLRPIGTLADTLTDLKARTQVSEKTEVTQPAEDVSLTSEFNEAAGIFRSVIKGDFRKDRSPQALVRNLMLLDRDRVFGRDARDAGITAAIDDEPLGPIGRGLLAALATDKINLETMKEIDAMDLVVRGFSQKSEQSKALQRENADRYAAVVQGFPNTFGPDHLRAVVAKLDGVVNNFNMRQTLINNLIPQTGDVNVADIEQRVREGIAKIKTHLEAKAGTPTQEPQETAVRDEIATVPKEDFDLIRTLMRHATVEIVGDNVGVLREAWKQPKLTFDPFEPPEEWGPDEEAREIPLTTNPEIVKQKIHENRLREREKKRIEKGEQRLVLDRIQWLFDLAEQYNGKIYQPRKPILGGAYMVCVIQYEGKTLAILENPVTGNATYAFPEELADASWDWIAAHYRKQAVRDLQVAVRTVHGATDDMESHNDRVFENIDTVLVDVRAQRAEREAKAPPKN